MNRRTLTSILLSLPALVLLGWFIVEQAPNWFPAAPVWLRVTGDDAIPGACEAMASLRAFNGRFSSDTNAAGLTADDARATADEVVAQTYDLPPGRYTGEAPALVRATFPDAGERLAWLAVADLDAGGAARLGKASIIYIDTVTGEALSVITAVSVTDARAACGGPPISRRVRVRQYLPLLALVGYVLIVLAGYAVVWLRRRQTHAQKV
jgi:hypothetical protein